MGMRAIPSSVPQVQEISYFDLKKQKKRQDKQIIDTSGKNAMGKTDFVNNMVEVDGTEERGGNLFSFKI